MSLGCFRFCHEPATKEGQQVKDEQSCTSLYAIYLTYPSSS